MKIQELINRTTLDFEARGRFSPRLDAEILLAHCLKKDRLYLYMNPDLSLAESDVCHFMQLASRRQRGEPVAYILGRKEFWSVVFEVNHQVLIPRPETELLVEECLKIHALSNSGHFRILELGTGSGVISVILSLELKNASLVATDISQEAMDVARRNAWQYGGENRITFLVGNLFDPVSGKFDMIVSNPPYISEEEFEYLPVDVRMYEPPSALIAGPDGMAFHREIVHKSVDYLKAGGWLFLEIGSGQKERVEMLLRAANSFEEIRFRRDYAGFDRVVAARKK